MVTRYERVVLELEDRFSREIANAAVQTKTFERSLRDLDGTSTRTRGSLTSLEKPVANIDRGGRLADRSINQLTGRLRLLLDVATTLGPALVPLGAGGAAAIAGLAAQFGALAGGIGVAVVALNGVGDALKAVNAYQLEPTRANLAKVADEFERLGPAGADFVVFLEQISPQLREIQMLAREGFLPGLADGIDSFLERGGQLNNIVYGLAEALGELSSSAGASLGGERFDAFFAYLESDAGPLLLEFGRSLGYVAEGFANLLVAFAPVSSDFSGGLEEMTRSFAEWSAGLQDNDSFQEFLSYIRENGPAALDFLGALVESIAAVVEAAAPVGQAVLPALTALLEVFSAIAGTPIGTGLLAAAAGFIAFNRAASVIKPVLSGIGDALFLTDRAFTDAGRSAEAARASMLRTGLALGAFVVAAQGVSAIANAFGDLNRHLDVSSASMENFEEVQSALADSNLGQYAAELGIDMQRLTEDFAANGREGAYVQKVLADLGAEGGNALKTLYDAGAPANEMLSSIGITFAQNAEEASKARAALESLLDGYEPTGQAARESAQGQQELAESADEAAASVEHLRSRLQAARAELKESRQAARDVAESFVGLGDSLNDSEKSLGDWLAELERNAAALRAFQENARQAARRGLDEGLVASLQAAGSEGALRMRQLANATDSEIKRANKAWRDGQGAVKDFVDEVGGVKPAYVTRLEAKVEQALADLARLRAQLDIPDEYVTVWVTRREANDGGMGPQTSADGGTVPKTGKPYADRHLYMLADGEEVISNRHGQADRHRALLKAINAGRLADGGTAGGRRYSLDQKGELLALERTIRDLTRELKADGKDKLSGLDRKIASNALAQAQQDLRQARRAPAREAREAAREAREWRRETRGDIRDSLSLEAGMSAEELRKEYQEFQRVLREAGIELPKNFDELREKSLEVAERFQKVTERIEKTEEALQNWRETADNIATSVRSIFNNNAFGLEGGGLANAMLQLEADRNDTVERNSLLQGVTGLAQSLGLDLSSEAFQSIATGADMQTLRDLDTAGEVQAFFDLFNSRLQEQNAAGQFAADAVTGTQIAALESTLAGLKTTQDTLAAQLEHQEERLEAAAIKGTQDGARAGVRDGLRDEERVKTAKAKTR